ncbi:NAD(P)-binding protein [Wolfiporia cocos MD-104 SS10]|uniref:NAD(P)-binding protein n=1 Tax=Wolfiporia cocos (strain MD-104) TaxID=742152 RepID=A0A2H3JTF4_WOLCO|nr:NAD(P)-binding protein [Wolfiporia cocos MD-104 SS10]
MSALSNLRRTAIVTGAAKGIGRAIAFRLADDGLQVAVNDKRSERAPLLEMVAEIESKGGQAMAMTADVSIEEEVRAMTAEVARQLGGLDVMVANAGVAGPLTPLVDCPVQGWEEIMAVNLRGVMLSYKHAAIQMIKQGRGGRIIGASSILGKQGRISAAPYSTTNFAVRGLTHSTARELARYNITVNAYAPGIILTTLATSVHDLHNGGPGSTIKKTFGLPLNTPNAEPEVVASLVSYLAKPEAHFITGNSAEWLVAAYILSSELCQVK